MTHTHKWLVNALLLDKKGGAKHLSQADVDDWTPNDGILWVHLNLTEPQATRWIKNDKYLSAWTKETLTDVGESRPRSTLHENALLLVIRTTNLTPRSEPDDMVFLRIFATQERLISVRLNPALSFKEIKDSFDLKSGPKNVCELIETILENTLDSTADTISDIIEQVDEIEEKIISHQTYPTLYDDLSELMRRLVVMHRFLAPERDALDTLTRRNLAWFDKNFERTAKDAFHRIQRIIEDITLLRERIRINQEALNQYSAKQSQKNMYMLSVIATIFLPLSFLTGLFGMNVGGIPFSEEPYGLAVTVLFIALIGILLAYLFKRAHWL
ncbi:MAG: hypothetical protein IKY98_01980 [Alphaproteobacteria bacterium]|nr:hypothetical protein [Alphaproteobacteria bacterium]